MLFLPERIDAKEALQLDLVTRLYDATELHRESQMLASRIAAAPAATLRMMKANMVSAEMLPLDQFIEIETARHSHIAAGPTLRAGFTAFMAARAGKRG